MAGVSPKFSLIDVLRVFRIMSDKPIGRLDIVRRLDLGEGSIRSILDILKEERLLDSTRKGHFLSTAGDHLASDIDKRLTGPARIECGVFINPFRTAVIVKKPHQPLDPIQLRDTALKWGSDAALVLVMERGSLKTPNIDAALDLTSVKEGLSPPEGCLVIITFAESQASADTSALAAAISADKILRDIILKRFGHEKSFNACLRPALNDF